MRLEAGLVDGRRESRRVKQGMEEVGAGRLGVLVVSGLSFPSNSLHLKARGGAPHASNLRLGTEIISLAQK